MTGSINEIPKIEFISTSSTTGVGNKAPSKNTKSVWTEKDQAIAGEKTEKDVQKAFDEYINIMELDIETGKFALNLDSAQIWTKSHKKPGFRDLSKAFHIPLDKVEKDNGGYKIPMTSKIVIDPAEMGKTSDTGKDLGKYAMKKADIMGTFFANYKTSVKYTKEMEILQQAAKEKSSKITYDKKNARLRFEGPGTMRSIKAKLGLRDGALKASNQNVRGDEQYLDSKGVAYININYLTGVGMTPEEVEKLGFKEYKE